jgi:hypothetical protein
MLSCRRLWRCPALSGLRPSPCRTNEYLLPAAAAWIAERLTVEASVAAAITSTADAATAGATPYRRYRASTIATHVPMTSATTPLFDPV